MAARAAALAVAAPLHTLHALETPSPFATSTHLSQLSHFRLRSGCLQLKPTRRSVLVRAGRRDGKRPRNVRREEEEEAEEAEEAAAEKALEALFAQLEMDLNSEDGDEGEEFTDEELEQMTRELEAVFSGVDLEGLEDEEEEEEEDEEHEEEGAGVVDMVMTDGVYSEASGAAKRGSRQVYEDEDEEEDEDEDEDEEDEDEEFDDDEERLVPLEKWQIRKLAAAAEKGRRNVNVKSLAAEVGMDRSDVLSFLKDPPPELMLMAEHWDSEDAKARTASIPELEFKVNVVDEAPRTTTTRRQPMSPSGGPQVPRSWHGNKRLKKEHIATFERVYRQSTRPSNAMIENLVNLTHVPRKKILQWFDDKRAENQPSKQSFGEASEN